jgi:putative ABC transport system ATP-binding protein
VAGDPAILLADEPTGNLDSRNGEAVMALLAELHAGGSTICIVTHDPRFAYHAERVVHLLDGRIMDEADALPGGAPQPHAVGPTVGATAGGSSAPAPEAP